MICGGEGWVLREAVDCVGEVGLGSLDCGGVVRLGARLWFVGTRLGLARGMDGGGEGWALCEVGFGARM